MKSLATLFALVCVFSGTAHSMTEDCSNAATQTAMNACAARELQAADAALNEAYAAVRANLPAASVALARSAQKAWISYRDAQCAFESAGSQGGSIYPMVVAGCRKELTEAQTLRLKAQATCTEGDVSCLRK